MWKLPISLRRTMPLTANNYRVNIVQSVYSQSVKDNAGNQFASTQKNRSSIAMRIVGKPKMKLADLASKGLTTSNKCSTLKNFVLNKANPAQNQHAKTVVIIFAFYGASEKAVSNYCRLYHVYGFDTVVVLSYLKHFAWPDISLELARDLLQFVKKTCLKYDHILIHAFSMGAYNFTVCMSEMYNNPELYSSIQNRIRALVYDSLTIGTLKNMAQGVGMGISRNSIVRTVIPLSMSLYFKLTSKHTEQVYEHYIDLFKQKPLQVPTLVFFCKNDPMSEYDVISTLVEDWRKRFSFNVMDKSWEKSKHSAHLMQHKEEYTDTVDKFLKSVPGLIKIDSKM